MAAAVLAGVCAIVHSAHLRAAPLDAAARWTFTAFLDGTSIGTHRYTRSPVTDTRFALTNDASFDVRILGIPVYAYRHQAREEWEGGCLRSVSARTEDNGTVRAVEAHADGGRLDVTERDAGPPTRSQVATPCAMSFAYWMPLAPGVTRLFDASTGRAADVTIAPLPGTTIEVAGQATRARGLRITGLAHPIDVWYAGDRWIGLDTTVDNGRHLSYRIE
ncbi:MAG: hypothetical protein JSR18_09430 [Proteobacteria bacterium]|nr:hypothetical protein [Pseudomonadota bacterium]